MGVSRANVWPPRNTNADPPVATVGRGDDDFCPVGAQQQDLFIAHLVGHDEDGLVALERRGDGQSHAGVAAGRLDDRPAWLDLAAFFSLLDDVRPDAVLHRAARIHEFQFCIQWDGQVAPNASQTNQWSMSHCAQNTIEDAFIL